MQLTPDNFLEHIQGLITGDEGFIRDVPVPLSALELNTTRVVDTSDGGSATDPVIESGVFLTSDETNARVIEVDEATDDILHLTIPVPRDYDETHDYFRVRVLASQKTVSTDDDVELDSELYIKTAGTALPADANPTAPGTVLTAAEQWIEFTLDGNDLQRDQVINFQLITNGANDTNAEEVLIHAFEYSYRSTLVSYNERDANRVDIR